jgi:hypothetical protein
MSPELSPFELASFAEASSFEKNKSGASYLQCVPGGHLQGWPRPLYLVPIPYQE